MNPEYRWVRDELVKLQMSGESVEPVEYAVWGDDENESDV